MARKRTWKSRPRSYGWVLTLPRGHRALGPLTYRGAEGMDYMSGLAEDGRKRRLWALEEGFAPEPLTVQELAFEEGVAAVAIYHAIKQARIDLFGRDLSDSAIYRRLARLREVTDEDPRGCVIEGCERTLPAGSRPTRRYCDFHASPAQRVRRHRGRHVTAKPRRASGRSLADRP